MSALRPMPLLALALAAGCTLEPDYQGARCLSAGGCPAGFYCEPASGLCELEPAVSPCSVNHGGCAPRAACTSLGPHVTCQCLASHGLFGDGGVCVLDEAVLYSLEVSASIAFSPPTTVSLPFQPAFVPGTFAYSAKVPAGTATFALSAHAFSSDASLKVNGEPMGSFFSHREYPVDVLPLTLIVEVTTTGGAQHRYVLAIDR